MDTAAVRPPTGLTYGIAPTGTVVSGSCGFCGYWHGPTCPNLEEVEYHPDGRIKRYRLRDPFPRSGCQCGAGCPCGQRLHPAL